MKLPLPLCGHFPNGAFNVYYDLTYFIFFRFSLGDASRTRDTQAASNSKANSRSRIRSSLGVESSLLTFKPWSRLCCHLYTNMGLPIPVPTALRAITPCNLLPTTNYPITMENLLGALATKMIVLNPPKWTPHTREGRSLLAGSGKQVC